ncbi:MAG TPA: 3-oxoacyl-[acyl-carrier-protein] reductase [Aggregatilinea sp.]|uniref:3-oxoacyl-[acyl-carrier-protein] reductase n=1 Tax=Aggregatilinea sp. TaxID=2806333 RepID=UPI002C106F07|nr:3-oxoacyl-[acyl-carrier-protein] reductase [Aggregatilinea sp.]HML22169.1 3-oxoacyl-[acyl-carrier-protein] reductase [Aggregatilinea sp.]
MSNLSGRIALVTGSGQGIGHEVALDLAKRGATVITNDISGCCADDTLEEVRALGSDGLAITADVSDAAQVEAMIKSILDAYGKIDILVNNAGTTRDNLMMRMPEEDWDLILRVNLKSAWLCSKAALRPMMRARYGRIINMASVSGIAGQAGQTNYSASKAGIIGMTKALAREVASRGITVNAVAPGFIQTKLTENLPQDILDTLVNSIPMGRWGTVEDVSNAVAFLAAEESSYITGHTLSVDGGLVMG